MCSAIYIYIYPCCRNPICRYIPQEEIQFLLAFHGNDFARYCEENLQPEATNNWRFSAWVADHSRIRSFPKENYAIDLMIHLSFLPTYAVLMDSGKGKGIRKESENNLCSLSRSILYDLLQKLQIHVN